jgi:hypothetical protein
MELEGWLRGSQEPVTAVHSDPDKSCSQPHISVKAHFNIILKYF